MEEDTSPEFDIINFESADIITTSDPEVTPLG